MRNNFGDILGKQPKLGLDFNPYDSKKNNESHIVTADNNGLAIGRSHWYDTNKDGMLDTYKAWMPIRGGGVNLEFSLENHPSLFEKTNDFYNNL